jgi:hypothetical protein
VNFRGAFSVMMPALLRDAAIEFSMPPHHAILSKRA